MLLDWTISILGAKRTEPPFISKPIYHFHVMLFYIQHYHLLCCCLNMLITHLWRMASHSSRPVSVWYAGRWVDRWCYLREKDDRCYHKWQTGSMMMTQTNPSPVYKRLVCCLQGYWPVTGNSSRLSLLFDRLIDCTVSSGYTLMHPSLARPYLMSEPPLHTDIIHYENIPGFHAVRQNILRWASCGTRGKLGRWTVEHCSHNGKGIPHLLALHTTHIHLKHLGLWVFINKYSNISLIHTILIWRRLG